MKKRFRKMRRKPLYLPLAIPVTATLALLALGLWWSSQWHSTTVVIVRHAEKMAVADDPGLTPAGQARSAELARMLSPAAAGESPPAVYSTDYRRTRDTAGPTAATWQTDLRLYEPGDARAFAREVRRRHRGATVLVVGHSNTVPELVAAFGGPSGIEIADDEYDNLFVLTVPQFGAATTLRMTFSAEPR